MSGGLLDGLSKGAVQLRKLRAGQHGGLPGRRHQHNAVGLREHGHRTLPPEGVPAPDAPAGSGPSGGTGDGQPGGQDRGVGEVHRLLIGVAWTEAKS